MLISQLIILPDFPFIFFLFFPSWTEQVPDGIFKWKHLCPLLPTENMLREKVCGSTKIGWEVKGGTKGISGNIDENRQKLRRTKAMHERININCPPIHICPFNSIWSFSNYFLLTSYWKIQIWFLFLVKSRSIALSQAINLNIFFCYICLQHSNKCISHWKPVFSCFAHFSLLNAKSQGCSQWHFGEVGALAAPGTPSCSSRAQPSTQGSASGLARPRTPTAVFSSSFTSLGFNAKNFLPAYKHHHCNFITNTYCSKVQ